VHAGRARGARAGRRPRPCRCFDTYFIAGPQRPHRPVGTGAYRSARFVRRPRRRFRAVEQAATSRALVNPPSPGKPLELPGPPDEAWPHTADRVPWAQAPKLPGSWWARLGRVAGPSAQGAMKAAPKTLGKPQLPGPGGRRRGPMSSPTDRVSGAGELPLLPTDLWWGAHLRETRWQLELYRLLVDPVFLGHGVAPTATGRPVGADARLRGVATRPLAGARRVVCARIGYRPEHLRVSSSTPGAATPARWTGWQRRVEKLHAQHGRRVGADRPTAAAATTRLRPWGHRRPELVYRTRSPSGPACVRCSRPAGPPSSPPPGRRGRRSWGPGGLDRGCCLTDALPTCGFARDFRRASSRPTGVRLTSIYSKGDGVVRWQSALVPYGELRGGHRQPRGPDLQTARPTG